MVFSQASCDGFLVCVLTAHVIDYACRVYNSSACNCVVACVIVLVAFVPAA